MCFDNRFGQIQSQAGTLCFTDGFVRAIEAVEHVRDVAGIDARTLVADTNDDLFRPDLTADANFATRGILDGIGDKIGQSPVMMRSSSARMIGKFFREIHNDACAFGFGSGNALPGVRPE